SVVAFFRIRTMTWTDPTVVLPSLAWIVTSLMLVLGLPKRPATANGTGVPSVGTASAMLLANAPAAPLRKPTAPALAAAVDVICRLTVGPAAPLASVTRTAHGDGAHVTKRAAASRLLLICSSTSTTRLPKARWLAPVVDGRSAAHTSPYNLSLNEKRETIVAGLETTPAL